MSKENGKNWRNFQFVVRRGVEEKQQNNNRKTVDNYTNVALNILDISRPPWIMSVVDEKDLSKSTEVASHTTRVIKILNNNNMTNPEKASGITRKTALLVTNDRVNICAESRPQEKGRTHRRVLEIENYWLGPAIGKDKIINKDEES